VFNGYIKDRAALTEKIAIFVGDRLMRGVYLGFLLWIIGLFFSPTFAFIVAFWGTFFCFFFGIGLFIFGLMVIRTKWREDTLFPTCVSLGALLCCIGTLFAFLSHIHIL
jgi:hypothetical protein